MPKPTVAMYRIFGGRRFSYLKTYSSKRDAQSRAARVRRQGYNVRIVKLRQGYLVYASGA
jgi:hypothetical protein